MQAGFALVENGSVRPKNSKNILMKNLFDFCVGGFIFWLVGFGIAFGLERDGGFIGTNPAYYASYNFKSITQFNPWTTWLF